MITWLGDIGQCDIRTAWGLFVMGFFTVAIVQCEIEGDQMTVVNSNTGNQMHNMLSSF